MIKILFLLLFMGVLSWNQPIVNPLPVPQTIVPNFQAPAMTLPKGTSITPLCDPSLNVPCLQQWAHQARPLAVTAPGANLPVMKYFLPSLLIRNSLPINTKMDDDWELFTPSFIGSRRSSSSRRTRYYKKKSDPGKVRRVTVNENEEVKEVVEADAIQVDAESVQSKLVTAKESDGDDKLKETGGRKQERGIVETETDDKSEAKADKAATERDRIAAEEKKAADERERVAAEEKKAADERERVAAEEKKAADERERVAAEEKKAADERERVAAEEKKAADERERVAAEEKKAADERERVAAEEKKAADERERVAAEEKKAAAERARIAAKRERVAADEKKIADERERVAAEEKKAAAKRERVAADERARKAAAEKKAADERARKAAAEKKAADERARKAAAEKKAADERARKAAAEKKAADERARKAAAEKKAADEKARVAEAEEKAAAVESAEEESGFPEIVTTEETSAPKGKVDSEEDTSSGCVEVKEEDDNKNLEAKAICETCYQGNPYLREGIKVLKKEGTWGQLVNVLQAVSGGGLGVSGSKQRISGKLFGTKICSPKTTLQKIINYFDTNEACRPYKFKDFYKEIYCEACKKQGIPAEIMLSMMTIESEAKCDARGDGDGSIGLFQINSKNYHCDKKNKKGSEKDKKCFQNPDKNLEFGIKDIKKKYNAINPKQSWKGGCSKWSELNSEEKKKCKKEKKTKKECEREKRDKWRKAVAAYNSGEGWVDRATQSMEGHAVEVEVSTISGNSGNIIEAARRKAIQRAENKIQRAIRNINRASNTKSRSKAKADKVAALAEVTALKSAQPVTDIDAKGVVQKVTFYKSRNFYKETSDLDWGHGGRFSGRSSQSKASWEEFRVYLFMEEFLPKNTRGTGRKTENTLSNLAHVEATLGRESKEGKISSGIVDYWEEYVKKHKPKTCPK